MRTLSALLLLALVMTVSAQFGPTAHSCCDVHYPDSQAVPAAKVVSYYTTSSSCFLEAHVLQTVTGNKICVKPHLPWVKRIVIKLDKKRGAGPASQQ